jgi:hypothetical protein
MRTWLSIAAGLMVTVSPCLLAETSQMRQAFFNQYCIDCHGAKKQKGDFRMDELDYQLGDKPLREQWDLVLDYVEFEDMPEEEAKHFPSDEERAAFVDNLRTDMETADAQAPIGKTPLRRLNRNEYLNTIRELVGVKRFSLPNSFPADSTTLPFDTMAEGLQISPALMDAYLETATLAAHEIVPLPELKQVKAGIESKTIGVDEARKWTREGDDAVFMTGSNMSPWSGGIWIPNFTAPIAGMYRVRILANAEAKQGADGKPLRFSFHTSKPSDYPIFRRALNSVHPEVASVEVTHLQPDWVECLVPAEKGEAIYAFCKNRFAETPPPYATKSEVNTMVKAAKASPAPTLRVETMQVEGPVDILPRQADFLGKQKARLNRSYLTSVLLPFAERAFRRPLTPNEADTLIQACLDHGKETEDLTAYHALHYGVRRILSSRFFLFLGTEEKSITDYDLVSRLSYFLWSSPPDERLLDLASSKQLFEPDQLKTQVKRMLQDPRSAQFVTHFAGQWLETRRTQNLMVCDVRYPWSETIRYGFIRSAELFFQDILQENLPISTFIDSDFMYANEPMLESWGLPVETDISRHEANERHYMRFPEPERIDLANLETDHPLKTSQRGGILGLSSVLASTGDGVESSPILRGVWVLDNLFGTPVPPPPANVPAIDVDISKANTVREILTAHKETESCNKCHRNIDPIGLALENYDAIGGWRSYYLLSYEESSPAGQTTAAEHPKIPELRIDPTSALPDGQPLNGPEDIKAYLLANRDLFTNCLTTKLFEYSTGREASLGDQREIRKIVEKEPAEGYGFTDLIVELALSEAFWEH